MPNLMKEALVSLRKIKEAEKDPKADMWCHFGEAIFRIPGGNGKID